MLSYGTVPSFDLFCLSRTNIQTAQRHCHGISTLTSCRQHFMEDFETMALMTADHQPTIWKRYVDDTFVIWPHGREKLEYFLHHINHLHKDITFTVEVEEDHKIAFLDVQIIRNNSTLETLVYCKPTHTLTSISILGHTTTPESSLASSNALLREQEKSAQKTIRRES